ncbi:MAG: N-acetyltransferase [Alphaproteobacteria bacterium]|nr:N-acetyltransferase [Alphaproteobacteria bacterium]
MSTSPSISFEVSELSAADSAWMAHVHAQSFDAPQRWSASAIKGLLDQPLTKAFGISINQAPVGFIIARNVAGEGEILTLAVLPDARRNGVASQLLNTFITQQMPQNIFLEVMVTNQAAIDFYLSHGFEIVSKRIGYYQMPIGHAQKAIDGFVMNKKLPTSQHIHKSP